MRKYLLPMLASAVLQAGIMDFQTLTEAKRAYEAGNFKHAAELFGNIKHKNAQALYDYGNALYKQKKYAEASGVFTSVTDPALKQRALHNLGNSLAMQGKTEEAIHAYEEALKLGEDEATRYNLNLLKQQKQDQKDTQNQQNKDDQKNKDDRKNDQQDQQNGDQNRSGQNQSTQNSDGSASSDNAQNEPQNNDENAQNSSASQNDGREDPAQTALKSAGSSSSAQAQAPQEAQGSSHGGDAAAAKQAPEAQQPQEDQAQAAMAEPISDMEERKYNQMLDKRGIKTLMIPLSGKGESHDDETTPW